MFAVQSASDRTAAELREKMVATLVEKNVARSPEVIAALRTVPRHLFKGVDLEQVYDPFQVALRKVGADGVTTSTMSASHIQAIQLEQAQVQPGHTVLEIGSGGTNAAYLAELVGPSGLVITMDIDEEITDRAKGFLSKAGYQQARVVTGDANLGAPGFAPFDVILVTVETTDIPDAWWEQLAEDGRIVAPIRWHGQRRTVSLTRQGTDKLVADDLQQAGFVPMQGIGEERERLVLLHDEPEQRVAVRVEGDTQIDGAALGKALLNGKHHVWTGVRLHRTAWYGPLDMWLATVLDTVLMTGDSGAHTAGLIPKPSPIGWPALVEGSSMAYRTLRPTEDEDQWELGVIGHGPAGQALATRYADAIKTWDPQARPHLTVSRQAPTIAADVTHRSQQRRISTLTISWS